jgi:hypothetical protein
VSAGGGGRGGRTARRRFDFDSSLIRARARFQGRVQDLRCRQSVIDLRDME